MDMSTHVTEVSSNPSKAMTLNDLVDLWMRERIIIRRKQTSTSQNLEPKFNLEVSVKGAQ